MTEAVAPAEGREITSGPYRALDFTFAVRTVDPATGRYLERALGSLRSEGEAPAPFATYVVERTEGGAHRLLLGDELVGESVSAPRIVSTLLWHVNRSTVSRSSDRFVLLHAAAAAAGGRAVVLPARMESGKTTLVAGLVRSGLRYLTDEAAAIELTTLLVHPFPKALSVDPGSWEVLADLRPDLDEDERRFEAAQWRVDPRAIRADAVSPPAEPALIVSPRYEKGATTELRPLSRARAVVMMVENSFNATEHGRAGILALAEVARRCRCFELVVGDLDRACELVLGELARDAGDARDARDAGDTRDGGDAGDARDTRDAGVTGDAG